MYLVMTVNNNNKQIKITNFLFDTWISVNALLTDWHAIKVTNHSDITNTIFIFLH